MPTHSRLLFVLTVFGKRIIGLFARLAGAGFTLLAAAFNHQAELNSVKTLDSVVRSDSLNFTNLDVERRENLILDGVQNTQANMSLLTMESEFADCDLTDTLKDTGFHRSSYLLVESRMVEGIADNGNDAVYVRDFVSRRRRIAEAQQISVRGVSV